MRTSGLLLVSLAMVVLASGAQARPSAPSDAASDVRLLAETIVSVHPDPFRSVSRQRFTSEANDLARRAPSLSRSELLVEVLRVIALLGPRNGHTGLFPLDPAHRSELHLYPLRLYDFADGTFVVDEAGDLGVVGARLVAVAGMPLADVLERVRLLVPHDNPSNLRGLAPHFALVAEVLAGLHISNGLGPVEFTFERPSGERVSISLEPLRAAEYRAAFADPHYGHYPSILPAASRPLYLASGGKEIWARKLAGGRAVYVGYNVVVSPPDAVLRKIRRLVGGSSVRRVIVDVRLNGGGDNTTYWPLTSLFGSKHVNRPGRLYLLVGRATFSAAANFAAEIDRDTRATIVGEPTGGGVETYGDTTPVAPAGDRLDRPRRDPVPRTASRPEGPASRRLAGRWGRPDLGRLLRGSRPGPPACSEGSLTLRAGYDASLEILGDEPVQDAVDPLVVAPVGLAANTLAREAGALGVAHRALIEGVDLELDAMEAQLVQKMALELPRGLVRDPPAPEVGVDREPAQVCDPAAPVRPLEAHRPCAFAAHLDDEHPERVRLRGRPLDLAQDRFAILRPHRGEERLDLVVREELDEEVDVVQARTSNRHAHAGSS